MSSLHVTRFPNEERQPERCQKQGEEKKTVKSNVQQAQKQPLKRKPEMKAHVLTAEVEIMSASN